MSVTKEAVLEQLKQVDDPELHRDLVTLNAVKKIAICEGHVRVQIGLASKSEAVRQQVDKTVRQVMARLGDEVQQLEIDFVDGQSEPEPGSDGKTRTAQGASQDPAGGDDQRVPLQQAGGATPKSGEGQPQKALPNIKHIIAVGSGKGGVGKSTIAVNLAVGLARTGLKVGICDADIYGPSIPTLLDLEAHQPRMAGQNMLVPFESHGISAMSIGKLVEPEKALILRGPMAQGAFKQLVMQTEWGELDYLILDLPPGTGDVPLTMAQMLPGITGAVVVCTPQKVAQDDARRALGMFAQLNVAVLGIVENMSYFIGDDGKEYDIFGRGGAQVMAHEAGAPFLGTIPINMRLRANSDRGNPTSNFDDDAQLGGELEKMVNNLLGQVRASELEGPKQPSLNIR